MELDKRIVLLTDIITCFKEDRSRAEKCIGQTGYFADDMMNFNDLDGCIYGKLVNYVIDEDYPFKCMPADIHYAFFIPESVLKLKPKKYRPFANTNEFFLMRNFGVGNLIRIRYKKYGIEYCIMIIGFTDKELMLGNFQGLSFDELFKNYELWDCEDNKFKPFGAKENE